MFEKIDAVYWTVQCNFLGIVKDLGEGKAMVLSSCITLNCCFW